MSSRVRPAQAEDAPFLAQVVLMAARSHVETSVWDLAIPTSDDDRLSAIRAALVTEAPSWCHYQNFVVAEVDGHQAAALSGYPAYPEGFLPMEKVFIAGFEALGYSEHEIATAFKSMLVFLNCHAEDEEGAWITEWVGCRAEFRRRGLVRALLLDILARGRERGHSRSQIGILIGNTAAQRAYEDVGYAVAFEKRDAQFEAAIGAAGLARLVLDY